MSKMRPRREEEYQRVLGFRASLWPWATERPEVEPAGENGLKGARHPIAWVCWRIELHRRGPYAPSFGDFLAQRRPR
jgi:hypothetical protein